MHQRILLLHLHTLTLESTVPSQLRAVSVSVPCLRPAGARLHSAERGIGCGDVDGGDTSVRSFLRVRARSKLLITDPRRCPPDSPPIHTSSCPDPFVGQRERLTSMSTRTCSAFGSTLDSWSWTSDSWSSEAGEASQTSACCCCLSRPIRPRQCGGHSGGIGASVPRPPTTDVRDVRWYASISSMIRGTSKSCTFPSLRQRTNENNVSVSVRVCIKSAFAGRPEVQRDR